MMGKIVKHCGSCDESFAEKFTFCPDCGAALQSYELNPLAAETPPVPDVATAPPMLVAEAAQPVETPEVVAEAAPASYAAETVEMPAAEVAETFAAPAPVVEAAKTAEEPVTEEIKTKAAAASSPAPVFFQPTTLDADKKPVSLEAEHDAYVADGGFYVTVIEEKNVKQRNTLLLGTLCAVFIFSMSMVVVSIYSKDLDIGSINDNMFTAMLVDDVPVPEEDAHIPKLKKDAGGGGGGGGNNDPNPASQGERAPMRTDPQFAPSVSMDRLTNPTIPIQMAIKGPINEYKINVDKYGVRLGGDNPSDGPGSNGGQGGGRNGGQGNNDGPGNGLGNNGGIGGPGNGGVGPGGDGPGGGGERPPPPHVGVTQGIKIISKPRPGYTDAARQANIQGTVILRVTFLASGQVGGISPVKGLGSGLTEQAIAAARRISFEPAKNNGVAQSVTKQIEYTFSIY